MTLMRRLAPWVCILVVTLLLTGEWLLAVGMVGIWVILWLGETYGHDR